MGDRLRPRVTHRIRDEALGVDTEVTCPPITGKFRDINIHELTNPVLRFDYLPSLLERQETRDVRDPGVKDVSVVFDTFDSC